MHPLFRAAAAGLLLVSLSPAVALGGPSESSSLHSSDGSAHPRVRATAGGTTTWVFSTDQSQFRPGTSNQGWWSDQDITRNSNENYIVGVCCGASHRNFFTFDLSGLEGTVVSATLVVRRFSGKGEPTETLRLFDVLTDPAALNDNRAIVPRIYKDLGRGHRYGTFDLSTADETSRADVFELSLLERALSDIQSAAGGFFSIGGRLLTSKDGGFLFGGSSGHGKQLLIVQTT